MSKDNKFIAVGDILHKTINKAGVGRQVQAAQICDYYATALAKTDINKKALDYSKAIHYQNSILTVAVLGASWAQEIQLRHHILIREINDYFGKQVINRINFRIG